MASLKIGPFLGVVTATLALCTVGAVMLPSSDYVRFQSMEGTIYDRADWIYDRVHYDPAPIDVLFLGTSRTETGVYPTLLEPALAKRGIEARVANMSLPSSGFDLRETIAELVFAEKSPRLVIFEVVEAFPRDGHEAFGDLASANQIVHAPWLINRSLPRNLARLPIRQTELALATLLPDAYGRRTGFDPASYAGTTVDPHDLSNLKETLSRIGTPEHLQTLTEQSERRLRDLTPPILPESFASVEFGVSRTYVERVVTLAHENGAEVAFLFLPFYMGPEEPIEKAWLTDLGPLWSAEFLRQDPAAYEDSAHTVASPEVKAAVSTWLANHIAGVLSKDQG